MTDIEIEQAEAQREHEKEMQKSRQEHEQALAAIEARKVMAAQSPKLFVFWDIVKRMLTVALWCFFWFVLLWG